MVCDDPRTSTAAPLGRAHYVRTRPNGASVGAEWACSLMKGDKVFQKLFEEWQEERVRLRFSWILSGREKFVLKEFVDWLESHGPTLRTPVQPANELLRQMKDYMLFDENYDVDLIVQKIDAVLKTAAGGYASPEKAYVIGGCREHGFIVPRRRW